MVLNTLAKMIILILFNTLILFITPTGVYFYIFILLWFVPFFCFWMYEYHLIAWRYMITLIIMNLIQFFVVPHLEGVLFFLTIGIISISIRIMPGFLMFYFFIKTTKVSHFVSAMQKIHIPKGVIVSFSVMFRFIPTIADEYRAIQHNLKLRGLTGINAIIHPFKSLEYRLIPLMVCVTSIGKDLTIGGLTRGISSPSPRTSIYEEGMSWLDYSFIIFIIILWIICLGGKVMQNA